MKYKAEIILTATLTTTALILFGCSGGEDAPETEEIRPVYTFTIQDPTDGRARLFSGTAVAAVETEISFRVPGKIVELPIKIGTRVKTGDLLAVLDTSDYELQVKQAESQVIQAEALLKQAKSQYARIRELYESENASKSDLDQARAAFESHEAQLNAAAKNLEIAQLQMNYCRLTAPIEGQIASRPVDIYQSIAAGQPVATLSADGDIEMQINIPEILINAVHLGAQADISFDAMPAKTFTGHVSEIGVRAEAMGSYKVKLSLSDNPEQVRPGMIGKTALKFLSGTKDVLLTPIPSVWTIPDGTRFVWVVNPESSTVERRAVELGAITSIGLEIKSGLAPGETVVTRGVHRLSEGTKVRLLDPAVNIKRGN